MALDDLRKSPMMTHLLEALERGEDIGEYGRLTFAMVAHHFLDKDELAQVLARGNGADEQAIRALVQQVEQRDYNPPRRQRILEWQAKQEFPICPNADDPDACNVYSELELPEKVFAQIEEYREQQFEADQAS
jgi:hypothetical protein